jgi:adenylate cyclase
LSAINERALRAPGCEAALWAHVVSGPFGNSELMHDAFSRMAACDPFEVRARVHLSRSSLWSYKPEMGRQIAVEALKADDHHWIMWSELLALIMLNDFEGADESLNNRPWSNDENRFARSILAAAQADLDSANDYQRQYLQMHGSDDQSSLVMEAAKGNRTEANRLAGLIDRRSFGYMSLMQAIYLCMCGAPFDLESTPVFAEMLSESGLPWPPLSPINFPLKDW